MKGVQAMHPCYIPGCKNSMPSQTTLECGFGDEGPQFVTRTPLAPGWGLVTLFAANAPNSMILACPDHLSDCLDAGCKLIARVLKP